MANCKSCNTSDKTKDKKKSMIENNPHNHVKNVIAVMSGKGGVGKSTITALLAKTLKDKGFSVGVLDADVTGPSIPRFLRAKNKGVTGTEFGMLPVISEEGISFMSLNLLLKNEEEAVIWRGPIIANTVKQFWTEVYWGELDYLLIDMPPGTGDVALTLMQSVPINGMVMVSTPQDMVSMIVAKAINMARTMEIPIVGIVENMSYITCPDCNKKIRVFGDDNISEYLTRLKIDLLGELPMSVDIADLTKNEGYKDNKELVTIINQIAEKIIQF